MYVSGEKTLEELLKRENSSKVYLDELKIGTAVVCLAPTETEYGIYAVYLKCTKDGYAADLYNIKRRVNTVSNNYEYVTVESVEFIEERENVYNGTVAVYHNYFTVDENTNTIVNQLNCGE